jgi:hypothetical protein
MLKEERRKSDEGIERPSENLADFPLLRNRTAPRGMPERIDELEGRAMRSIVFASERR